MTKLTALSIALALSVFGCKKEEKPTPEQQAAKAMEELAKAMGGKGSGSAAGADMAAMMAAMATAMGSAATAAGSDAVAAGSAATAAGSAAAAAGSAAGALGDMANKLGGMAAGAMAMFGNGAPLPPEQEAVVAPMIAALDELAAVATANSAADCKTVGTAIAAVGAKHKDTFAKGEALQDSVKDPAQAMALAGRMGGAGLKVAGVMMGLTSKCMNDPAFKDAMSNIPGFGK